MASEKHPLSGRLDTNRPPAIQTQRPFSITAEVTALISALREVETTEGKDARKARKLVLANRVFLRKLGEQNPAVAFILQGRK